MLFPKLLFTAIVNCENFMFLSSSFNRVMRYISLYSGSKSINKISLEKCEFSESKIFRKIYNINFHFLYLPYLHSSKIIDFDSEIV